MNNNQSTTSSSSDSVARTFVIFYMVTAHFVVWLILMLSLWLGAPRFKSIFQDLNAEIPVTCRWVLHASNTVVSYFYLFFPLLILFVFFDLAVQRQMKKYRFLILWHMVMLSIPTIGLIMVAMSLLNTTQNLMENLN